ncbi:40S ribosomal protein S11 [Crotalus adamanteus]|uniref:Small ribosomal subunit protein uS17 n=1 Tax=Crotalus adamanteus TaxID=8729 RepID=A0AAW1BKJ1_CROAD
MLAPFRPMGGPPAQMKARLLLLPWAFILAGLRLPLRGAQAQDPGTCVSHPGGTTPALPLPHPILSPHPPAPPPGPPFWAPLPAKLAEEFWELKSAGPSPSPPQAGLPGLGETPPPVSRPMEGRTAGGRGGACASLPPARINLPACRARGLFSLRAAKMADTQTERAYQKQPTIFQNKKRVLLGDAGKEKLPRYYKNIGLGFKTPKEAIEGTYIDKKCPFTGNVSIRGRILSGVVTKMKMQRTIVIRRDYLHYIRKYNRFEKRHKNMSVHLSPCFRDVQIGDIVTVGECRPLSKTVRFNVLKVHFSTLGMAEKWLQKHPLAGPGRKQQQWVLHISLRFLRKRDGEGLGKKDWKA